MQESPILVLNLAKPKWCISFLPSIFTFPTLSALSVQFAGYRQYDKYGILLMSKCNNIHIIIFGTQLHEICAVETIFEKSLRNFFSWEKIPPEKIPVGKKSDPAKMVKISRGKFPTGKYKH